MNNSPSPPLRARGGNQTPPLVARGGWEGLFLSFVLVVSFLSWLFFRTAPTRSPYSGFVAQHPAISDELLGSALAVREPWHVKKGARVFILPHHVVAAKEIASLIGAMPRPSVVYLISPDHFTRGKTVFTTSDADLASHVVDASVDDEVIQREHGITALASFFERLQPGVPVIPVLVRIDAATSSRLALVDELTRRLREDPRAVLVASIDFSHYLPAEVADFHDVLAEDVIRALGTQEADSAEIDSPGSLFVALSVARVLGLGDVNIHAHTNSLRLLRAIITKESTSHFLVSFSPGEISSRHVQTFLRTNIFDVKSTENRYYRGFTSLIRATSTTPFAEAIVESDGVEVSRFQLPIVW